MNIHEDLISAHWKRIWLSSTFLLQLLQLHASRPLLPPFSGHLGVTAPGYPAIIGFSSGCSCVEKDLGYTDTKKMNGWNPENRMVLGRWFFFLVQRPKFSGSNDVSFRGCTTNLMIFSFMLVGFSRWIHFVKQRIMSCWILGIHVELKQTSVSIIVVLYLTWPGNIPANKW